MRTCCWFPIFGRRPDCRRINPGRRACRSASNRLGGGRHQFYTVRISGGTALPAFKGSGDITSLSQADGYIEIPPDQGVIEQGTLVDVTLF